MDRPTTGSNAVEVDLRWETPKPTIKIMDFKHRRHRIAARFIEPLSMWIYEQPMVEVGEDYMTPDEVEMWGHD